MSRSCFESWRSYPNGDGTTTPRKGRYYFLGPRVKFLSHTGLGGHWWEGHPFQVGDLATEETPKPVWVNGSRSLGSGYPDVVCCCGLYPPFVASRVHITIVKGAATLYDADQTLLVPTAGFIQAYWSPLGVGYTYYIQLTCDPCDAFFTSSPCLTGGAHLDVFIEDRPGDTGYQVTARGTNLTVAHPTTTVCKTGCVVTVRFYA